MGERERESGGASLAGRVWRGQSESWRTRARARVLESRGAHGGVRRHYQNKTQTQVARFASYLSGIMQAMREKYVWRTPVSSLSKRRPTAPFGPKLRMES